MLALIAGAVMLDMSAGNIIFKSFIGFSMRLSGFIMIRMDFYEELSKFKAIVSLF